MTEKGVRSEMTDREQCKQEVETVQSHENTVNGKRTRVGMKIRT